MNLEGVMDTISLRRSERISNRIKKEVDRSSTPRKPKRKGKEERGERISNRIKNGVAPSSTPCKPKRKGTTSTLVQCERSNKMGRLIGATSPISMLPDELVKEILSRLPPKPFFRSRSVCKYWLSLSSDASHSNKHLQPTVIGFFYNYYSSIASSSYLSGGANMLESGDGRSSALPRYLTSVKVLDCCNGLVLLSASSQSKSQPFNKVIYVYNPATQSLSALMSLSKFQNDGEYSCFSLAFDSRAAAPHLLYSHH